MNPTAASNLLRLIWGYVLLCGCMLIVGLGIWILLPARPKSKTSQNFMSIVAGDSKSDEYHNPYFGFTVKYDGDWRDVSASQREALVKRTSAATMKKNAILLAIERGPQKGATNLTLTSAFVSKKDLIDDPQDYLRMVVTALAMQRSLGQESIRIEGSTVFAGIKCFRATVALGRTTDGKERHWTYWVGQKGDYRLVILGTYSSEEDFEEIQRVLGGMPVEIDRPNVDGA